MPAKWLKLRPEFGCDCLTCAEFDQERPVGRPIRSTEPLENVWTIILLGVSKAQHFENDWYQDEVLEPRVVAQNAEMAPKA